MKLTQYWLSFQLVLSLVGKVTLPPSSPCPSVFQYVEDPSHFHRLPALVGSLILAGVRTNFNNTVEVVLSLSRNGGFSSSYASIKLLNLDKLPEEPAKFVIYFPDRFTTPNVVTIVFNGKQVCRGSPADGRWVTTITLHYYVMVASRNAVKTTRFFNSYKYGRRRPTMNHEDPDRGDQQGSTESTVLPEVKSYDGDCGRPVSPAMPLLMGGMQTRRSEWPWLGVLFYKNRDQGSVEFRCGASLISSKVLLTAGHCLLKVDGRTALHSKDVLASLSRHNILDWSEPTSKTVTPRDLIIHPSFSGDTFDYDIGIVTLPEPIIFTSSIRPICLWNNSLEESLLVGQLGTVVGWGFSHPEGTISETPKQVQLQIVSEVDCIRSDPGLQLTTSARTFCAGGNGTGPCQGDSGSGLYLAQGHSWVLRGIVSHSLLDPQTGKCDTRKYSVYTDVAKYRGWLKEQTGDDFV
ncbi:hypothetical protein quinque_000289 [Culex quinquefasciatus]